MKVINKNVIKMARFLKVHHKNDDGEIEEYTVNLEMIVDVDEESKEIDLADALTICVTRDNEWQKLMSFVKANEL